jgi:hypothetical protein
VGVGEGVCRSSSRSVAVDGVVEAVGLVVVAVGAEEDLAGSVAVVDSAVVAPADLGDEWHA